MKGFIAISLLLAVSLVQASEERTVPFKFDEELKELLIEELRDSLRAKIGDPGITAVLNDYADTLFAHIANFALKHKLDPIALDDVKADLLLAHVTLTNGSLHGISTLEKYGDVMVNYQHSTKVLTFTLPIEFTEIAFTYDYLVHALVILGVSGDMVGDIKEFKFYLEFSFDIPNLTASIQKLKTTDSGHISVQFHGHAITDLIINILSEFVTTILHPLIQGVIEAIIKGVASNVVNNINELLYNITHPNPSNVTYVPQFTQYVLN